MDAYVRVVASLSRVAGVIAAFLVAAAVLVICDMVIERYLLNRTTIWQIDVVTYCIVSATFVGSAYVLMTRGHVNVDVLPLHLAPRPRYWLALFTVLIAMAFCVVLFVLCALYWYEAWSKDWHSDTVWRARLWIPYLAMPVGLGLLVLQYIAELICLVTGRAPPFGLGEDMSFTHEPGFRGFHRSGRDAADAGLGHTPWRLGLGAISIIFLLYIPGFPAACTWSPQTFYAGLDEFTLVAIPMFVMMGAAIGSSPAGKDLYEALDRWLYRLPGGLVISNLGACAIFAALTGSSPACCAAIGKMGIPEMRRRGYPDEVATGSICAGGTLGILIPPSVTFILYGIATETSIGRLFIAGVMPGIMLTGLFMLWSIFAIWRSGFRSHAVDFRYSWKEKFTSIPKIAPFIAIIVGVMYALYGGVATPSEAAGVGAGLCLVLAVVIYRLWRPDQIWMICATRCGNR